MSSNQQEQPATQGKGIPISPYEPGQRTLKEIEADLCQPVPEQYLSWKPVGSGNNERQVAYLAWHTVEMYLNYYAPGWKFRVNEVYQLDGRVAVRATLTILANVNGQVWEFERDATGQEENKVDKYGDPVSNAEGMAYRRSAAKFGLGLYLYYDKPQYQGQSAGHQHQGNAPQRAAQGGADRREVLPISPAQIALARRLAGQKGHDEENLCSRKWNTSLVEINMKQASELIDYLNTLDDAPSGYRPPTQAPQTPRLPAPPPQPQRPAAPAGW